MNQILIVAVGGALGSVLRFLIQRFFVISVAVTFPMGTFIVNILGCLLIGIIWGIKTKNGISDEATLFLMTGLCGGFTTFSAFSSESVVLLHQDKFFLFLLYVTLSVVLGFSATYAGHYLTK